MLVCLKPSSNCSVSQMCWPILSNNMEASARRVAFAVDAPVSRVSTGGAIKRVSRQRNLSAPDTPTVVWLYRADRFDGGHTGRRGSFCLLSGSVNSLWGKLPVWLSGHRALSVSCSFPIQLLAYLQLHRKCPYSHTLSRSPLGYLHVQKMCKYTATNLDLLTSCLQP